MNLALITKQPLFKKILLKQLAYYANGWCDFVETSNDSEVNYQFETSQTNTAKIIIVAKQHYAETWHSYPSVSKKELEQIIKLQKSNHNAIDVIYQTYKNVNIDGFKVKKTTFDKEFLAEIDDKKILIPETELFFSDSEEPKVISMNTPAGLLLASYFSGKTTCSYAKGIVSSIDTFKLTCGLPENIETQNIDTLDYANFLFSRLSQINIDKLVNKLSVNVKSWFKTNDMHLLYWAPTLTAVCFYIIINSYLWVSNNLIESSLSEYSTEVQMLLSNKVEQDKQRQLLSLLNKEFANTQSIHHHWSILYQLVENDMIISRLTYNDKVLTVRGNAKNASKILALISEHPQVDNAVFEGTVSRSRGKESFTLALIPKAALNDVKKLN